MAGRAYQLIIGKTLPCLYKGILSRNSCFSECKFCPHPGH